MILILALFLIIFEAVYEGLKTKGLHVASASVEFVYRAAITFGLFAWATGIAFPHNEILLWKVIVGYVLLRFALFDVVWNISAGQKVFYIGSTKLYDRVMTKLASWGWFVKACSLIVGLVFLIKK